MPLKIGKLLSGRDFTLPDDYQVHTTALIGIRGSGKTVAATDLAEEMCDANLPFVAIDPVGVWWGLRTHYPVVVIGGEHGDVPLEKDRGAAIAEAILEHSVSCIIDMSAESKNTVRKFVTDFCDRLMERNPSGTRHIFLEEAPELVPQKPLGEQKRSLAAVDRLVRLGRNKGYGCTLLSQRFATINKDVLTQCENLIALRCIGKHDRDAAASWIAEVVHDTESEKKAEKFIQSLTVLDNGEAWFWSPQWLKEFIQVQFRPRNSFHPGATRSVGEATKQVKLMAVETFVELFKRSLADTPAPHLRGKVDGPSQALRNSIADVAEIERLTAENAALRKQVGGLMGVVQIIRENFQSDWDALSHVFGSMEQIGAIFGKNGSMRDGAVWEPWKQKLGAGPAKIIDILLSRGELTRVQLKTLAGYSARSMTNIVSALHSNQLIEKNGDKIRLRSI